MKRSALVVLVLFLSACTAPSGPSPFSTAVGQSAHVYSSTPPIVSNYFAAVTYSFTGQSFKRVHVTTTPRSSITPADTVNLLEDPILASSDELFVGLSNGSPQIAFFGVSGPNAGSVSFTGNCSVTNPTSLNCNVPYTWAEGTSYELDIARTAKTSSTETWVGTVTNDSSHVSTIVASVTVPASWGDFTSNLSFLAV